MHERLRNYITSNGIQFRFVADRAGIGRDRFYKLMDGTTRLSVDDYEAICRNGLQLDPGYFFNLNVLDSKTEEAITQ